MFRELTRRPRKRSVSDAAGNGTNGKPSQTSHLVQDLASQIRFLRLGAGNTIQDLRFPMTRVQFLSKAEKLADGCEGVMYWMSRDQRVQDNWALLFAQKLALQSETPLHVCFCLVPKFLDASYRQYSFMLKGLQEVERECKDLDISFHLLLGNARDVLPNFVEKHKIGGVVTDFSPLRVSSQWREEVKVQLSPNVLFCQVDAHNIVPCWETSKQLVERPYLIRPLIYDQLPVYLTEIPPVVKHPHPTRAGTQPVDWLAAEQCLEVDRSVPEVTWATPGTSGGLAVLDSFLKRGLVFYSADRNNPTKEGISNLSPWFHFGQISVQRVILMLQPLKAKYKESVEMFTDEAVTWKEMADNNCYYNPNYDNIQGAPDWARETLDRHRQDKRDHLYSRDAFEQARTHDKLWNACQRQMMVTGKMHGYMRMYWAKKMLEWTESPEQALQYAIYLNDKYELDGRDPCGYLGCLWSICGSHDRAFPERPVYGAVRYMGAEGCRRKFDVNTYLAKNLTGY